MAASIHSFQIQLSFLSVVPLKELTVFCPLSCVLPVVMYRCASWTIKKAERQTVDVFEVWCWRRLLRVPWTTRTSNQAILKEINPEYSLEGLMLKLKLQYFGHLLQRANPLGKTWCSTSFCRSLRLRTGAEGGDRGWDGWMASPTMDTSLSKFQGDTKGQGGLVCCSPCGCRVGHGLATE